MAATPPGDLLSTSEVAELTGLSVPTITRMARDGRLPVFQKLPWPTGSYLFRRRDVERLLLASGSTTRKAS